MTEKKISLADIAESVSELDEEEAERYTVTEAGHTALAEAYWRAKIAEEIRKRCMPKCVCDQCTGLRDSAIVQYCIDTALGKKR